MLYRIKDPDPKCFNLFCIKTFEKVHQFYKVYTFKGVYWVDIGLLKRVL